MARSHSLRPLHLVITTALLFFHGSSMVQASQRSIHLDANGLYKGIVVGFSSDFEVATTNRATFLQNVMTTLQNSSDILNEMLGVQLGEVTIRLPDGWPLPPQHEVDAQYKPLSEADFIFTESPLDKPQILTMQYGLCGEGAQPINFPKTYIYENEAPRLFAHQWLLYRYGVYNEFGYLNDRAYPVYYYPAHGGILNVTMPDINSCSDMPNLPNGSITQCPNTSIDPNTGLPTDLGCDVTPINNSIQSSFLFAPTVVSQPKLCDGKIHDYLSPNKQNVLCDYQSAEDVIRKHADFDGFKHVLSPNRASSPIKFHFWQNSAQSDKGNSFVVYAFPSGSNKLGESLLKIIKGATSSVAGANFLTHQTKVRFFDSNHLQGNLPTWTPSDNIDWGSISTLPISASIDLIKVLGQTLNEFVPDSPATALFRHVPGTCVFTFSGKHQAINIDNEIAIDNLANQFNSANVTLRVMIIEELPRTEVIKFFDHLISKLITRSSVNYALSSTAIVPEQSQMFATLNSVIFDAVQDSTEQTHILLKSETFQSAPTASVNFTLDETLPRGKYRLLIDVFTTGDADNKIHTGTLSNNAGSTIPYITQDKSTNMRITLYDNVNPGMYNFVFTSTETSNHWVTVSVRALLKSNAFNSYEKEMPIVAKCWLVTDGQYPVRGYVQVGQGLNAPVHNVDVSLMVRRYTTGQSPESFNIPLQDNGRANPDITEEDGIYSAYLDELIRDNTEATFTVQARIYSESGVDRKPANFGNTVLWKNKPRCCGSRVTSDNELVARGVEIRRVVTCGSFHHSPATDPAQDKLDKFSINDLRIVSLNAENRTVTLQWNSPFGNDGSKYEVKAFHTIPRKSNLTTEIKEQFDQKTSVDYEIVTPQPVARPLAAPQHYAPSHYDDQSQSYEMFNLVETYAAPIVPQTPRGPITITVHILYPEEGYYYLAVKDRNDSGTLLRQTKPSNIVPIYLKSNYPIENISALASDDSRLSAGPYRPELASAGLTWWHILIIILVSALFLFIVIALLICVCLRKRRHSGNKQTHVDYEVKKKASMDTSFKQQQQQQQQSDPNYYLNQDSSSVNSNDRNAAPASNVSNNTSCSSVNTVDNGNVMHSHQHLEPHHPEQHQPQRQMHNPNMFEPNMGQQHHHAMQPHPNLLHTPSSHHSTNPSLVKELNVATLLPNSWDAKELLDHWGRVQEAKQRHESPPVMRMQTASPSIPSFGGSSLDNYNQQGGYHQFQPATVQQVHHYPHEAGLVDPSEYHQPPLYSPYSNASSIWQHQQQQQQQQPPPPIRQYQPMPQIRQWAEPSYTPTPMNEGGYDDNGLPEYSVVRKHHPNISQV